jgi:hypothetical protein
MSSALETQVGGSHYKDMPIQPMEYSMANGLDACQHTIVKYVTRFREKGGLQDLEKARHVIDMLIEFERKAIERAATPANDNAPRGPLNADGTTWCCGRTGSTSAPYCLGCPHA